MDIFQKCFKYHQWKEEEIRQIGFHPYFVAIERNSGPRVTIDGRELIMIGSNNYLGLSWDPRVKEAAIRATETYGTSCSGSRFLNGTLTMHLELEERLATFMGKERAVCFTTGYQSNLGAVSALLGRNDHVFTDRWNHASLMDGVFLASGVGRNAVRIHRYAHNSPEDLEKIIANVEMDGNGGLLIATDGVFSMDGDIVRLREIKEIADRYGARIYLDEAHAIGVIGDTGRGTEEHLGVTDYSDLTMCTFSKSFGAVGGFVAGKAEVVDYIQHHARPLLFSASMPPATVAAVMRSLEIIETEPEHVQRLQCTGKRMVDEFRRLGFHVDAAETPIVPLIIGDDRATFRFWHALFEHGVYANPVVSPAVPPDRSLIRTSFMAVHTDDDLDQVLEIAEKAGREAGVI